jgi:hypothetical protein
MQFDKPSTSVFQSSPWQLKLRRGMLKLFFALCLVAVGLRLSAQELALKPYAYPIESEGTSYTGEGVDWITGQMADKQFLLFGEQHGIAGIPMFVESLYERLQSSGFKHLILEIDATTSQELSRLGVEEFIAQYPHSIAFDYNGELRLIDKVRSMHSSEQVIWGMDQMVTAIHPFQMLEKMAGSFKTRRLCRGLHLKATMKAGQYLDQDNFHDLTILKSLFEKEDNQAALEIIDQISVSMEIYNAYHAARRGEQSYRVSSAQREEYMKQWFDDFTKKAGEDGQLPKAIVKMGGAHTTYGIGPNGVPTLGDHLDKLAKENGSSILSLGIMNGGPGTNYDFQELFGESSGVLIDSRSVFNNLDSTALAGFEEGFLKNLRYFDAVIYLNASARSSTDRIRNEENAFVRNSIIKLVPFGLLLLLNLSLLFPLISWVIRKVFNTTRPAKYMVYHSYLFIVGLLIDIALLAQVLSILNGTPSAHALLLSPGASFFIFAGLFTLVCSVWIFFRLAGKKGLWSVGMRRHYLWVAVGNVMLVLYMYYWNMGGMLG